MVVGLTGGIGSGKTTVANFFSEFKNVAVYIADLEAKKIINTSRTVKEQICKVFGKNAYTNNSINKNFIANIVFNDSDKLQILNSIVHPKVNEHFKNFVKTNKDKLYVIYESAILFESNSQANFDYVILVDVDVEQRISRVIKRDQISREEVLKKIDKQWTNDKKSLLSNYLITNYLQNDTVNQVNHIHNILTKKTELIY